MLAVRKVFLVWIMVLAMPIQGFAAAGMQHCAATPERLQTGQASHATPDAHDHAHATDAGSNETGTASEDSAVTALSGTGGDATLVVSATDEAQCSACAACCSACAMPAIAQHLPEPPSGVFLAAFPDRTPTSFVPDALDRPPRAVAA